MLKGFLSLVYFSLYKTNKLLYDKGFLKAYSPKSFFVIGVGNLSVGGSGKTPFVVLLSKYLDKKNKKHCIVSRGYKKKLPGNYIINNQNINNFNPQNVGDEPFMLAKELPHSSIYVGDKLKNIKEAEKKQLYSHVIIDDAYQSFGIVKNYNVLLIDFSVNLKKYCLLPKGFLREPLSEIKRANLIVFTKTNLISHSDYKLKKSFFKKYINPDKQSVVTSIIKSNLYFENKNKLNPVKKGPLSKKYISFSGIGNPKSFSAIQKKLCLVPLKNFVFKDHYNYPKKTIQKLLSFCKTNSIQTILTTKKDYYKISSCFKRFKIYVLDIEHELLDDFNF